MGVGLFVAPAPSQPALTSVLRCGTFEPVRLGHSFIFLATLIGETRTITLSVPGKNPRSARDDAQ